jgi:hypothetical protein
MKQKKKRIPESEQTHQKAIASVQARLYTSCTESQRRVRILGAELD